MLKTGELLIGTGDGVVCRANQIELVLKDPVKKLEDKSSRSKKSKPKTEMRLKEAEYVFNLLFVVSVLFALPPSHPIRIVHKKKILYNFYCILLSNKCLFCIIYYVMHIQSHITLYDLLLEVQMKFHLTFMKINSLLYFHL